MNTGQIGSAAQSAAHFNTQPSSVSTTGSAAVKPVQPTAAIQQQDPTLLSQALQSINQVLQASSSNIEFTMDDEVDRIVVKVVDRQTGDVIRQMPTPEALEIAKALDRVIGKLIHQEA